MARSNNCRARQADRQSPDINCHDLAIAREGGSTVALDFLPEHLDVSKNQTASSLSSRYEQLWMENGALPAEISFWRSLHKECLRYTERVQTFMYENHHKGFHINENKPIYLILLRQEIAIALIRAYDQFWESVERRQRRRRKLWQEKNQDHWV